MVSLTRSGFGGRGERKPIRLFGEAIGTSAFAVRYERANSAALRRCLCPDSDDTAARIGPKILSWSLRRTEVNFDSLDVTDGGAWAERRRHPTIHKIGWLTSVRRSRCLYEAREPDAFGSDAAHGLKEVGQVYRVPGLDLCRRQKLAAFRGAPAIEIFEPVPDYAPAPPAYDDLRQDGRDRGQLEDVSHRLAGREIERFGGRYVAHRVDLHDV